MGLDTARTGFFQQRSELVELFIQGPSGLKGDVPACAEGDLYCMATVSRSTAPYRYASFPIFYLHFWSMGAPPTSNPCKFVMTTRFTIPGLWSSSALQSSTLLGHNVKMRGSAQCARYTHLLGYAPAVPGGCTANYQSFLATADPQGMLHNLHQIFTPEGARYDGSLSGLAVAAELGTVFACGKEHDAADFSLLSFKISDIQVGFEAAGVPASTIQLMGRWSSDIYCIYTRICHTQVLSASRAMGGVYDASLEERFPGFVQSARLRRTR